MKIKLRIKHSEIQLYQDQESALHLSYEISLGILIYAHIIMIMYLYFLSIATSA